MNKAKRVLYTGLNPENFIIGRASDEIVHLPLIEIVPKPITDHLIQIAFSESHLWTHILLTSRSSASIFMDYAKQFEIDLQRKVFLLIGQATKEALEPPPITSYIADDPQAEGSVELLKKMDLKDAYIFYPHSALSRSVLSDYLKENNIRTRDLILYDTKVNLRLRSIDLNDFSEIVFTSPSTIDAFLALFGSIPTDKCLTTIGPVTRKYLEKSIKASLQIR